MSDTAARVVPHRPAMVIAGSVGVTLVVAAAVALGLTGRGPTTLDTAWYQLLDANRIPILETAALALNYIGGTLSMTIISVMVVVALGVIGRRREAVVVGVTVLAATSISTIIKLALERPRPSHGSVDLETSSFPSGHTTAAAAVTIALALLFSRVWVWVLAAGWIVAMALSRTYLLVHWATDVIAGAVLGASIALLVFAIVQGFGRRLNPAEN